MLKGKKKLLAAQVLLGLMVAGNAYTVDCGVASAADFVVGHENTDLNTDWIDGGNKSSNADDGKYCAVIAGKRADAKDGGDASDAHYLSGETEINNKHIVVSSGGGHFAVIRADNGSGNVVDLGNPYSNPIKYYDVKVFDGGGLTNNVVNIVGATVHDYGKIDAGAGNIMNIDMLYPDSSASNDYTFKAGTINMNTSYTASNNIVLDASDAGANGVININVDNVTAKKIDASSDGTVNVFGSNAKSDDITAQTLKINGNGSLITDNLNNVANVVIDGSASEDALIITGSDGIGGANVRLVNAVDASSSALFVKEVVANTSSSGVKLNKTITGTREQSKSLVETQMASMALANGSADLVAGAGYTNAAQAVQDAKDSGDSGRSMVPYVAANYGSMRQESGSHVDVKGSNFNIGFAKEVKNGSGKLLFGPMFEYGRGNYDSYLDDGTTGSGTAQNYGIGMMARQTNDNGFYYEGSVRYGKVTSDYSSSNVWAGHDVSYDNSAKYWGAHVGVGKLQKLGGDNAIDLYGKLFYTNQGSSSVNIDGDTLDFSSVKSKRSRIGFRYIHGTSDVRSVYAGLAWQYEFDGAAHATANGLSTPSPSVKGSSGMLELGVLIAPKASPVSFDLGVSGWAGKQKGYSLNANMLWSF